MGKKDQLFKLLGVENQGVQYRKHWAKEIGLNYKNLKMYNDQGLMPLGKDLDALLRVTGLSKTELQLRLGAFTYELENYLAENAQKIAKLLSESDADQKHNKLNPDFKTSLGEMYRGDCLEILKTIPDSSVDMVFADPPFNLKKFYLSGINDGLSEREYLEWSEKWLTECCRVLAPGGSLFVWNLPKWSIEYGKVLNRYLCFRHWIATDIKYGLPISGRLYPSHYGLLYYTKGQKPKTFKPDRLPMQTCSNCFSELKDYGGYKNKMNPKGINLTDVWYDIPPVRHSKYKKRVEANELSVKLLDRIIEISTEPGDTVLDPFGGSGTTYIVAEMKNRKWIGMELGPVDQIKDRFNRIGEEMEHLKKIRKNLNVLFTPKVKAKRFQLSLWTDDTFKQSSTSLED